MPPCQVLVQPGSAPPFKHTHTSTPYIWSSGEALERFFSHHDKGRPQSRHGIHLHPMVFLHCCPVFRGGPLKRSLSPQQRSPTIPPWPPSISLWSSLHLYPNTSTPYILSLGGSLKTFSLATAKVSHNPAMASIYTPMVFLHCCPVFKGGLCS